LQQRICAVAGFFIASVLFNHQIVIALRTIFFRRLI
jgi:hypothetical protein